MYYLSYETEIKSRGREGEDFKKTNNRNKRSGGKRKREKGGALREGRIERKVRKAEQKHQQHLHILLSPQGFVLQESSKAK